MHNPTHDRTRGGIAALVVILAVLAAASLYVPPLSGVAALAVVLGVLGIVAVARVEVAAR